MIRRAESPLWERPGLRRAAGDTLRPGGFALTDRGAEAVALTPGRRVLDVGCGLGATVARLRSRYGVYAYGVEPSPAQLARASAAPGLIRARGTRLPFRSGCFDALFCECVFSLFADRRSGLREFHRVLRPGGFLVLSDVCALEKSAQSPRDPAGSCADRAATVEETGTLVRERGFTLRLLEDHSHRLRELAARLILAGEDAPCACAAPLGYYLMIAEKGESHV